MIGIVLKLYTEDNEGEGIMVVNATLNNISVISAEDMQRLILTI